mgnify:CR=1 FL=1
MRKSMAVRAFSPPVVLVSMAVLALSAGLLLYLGDRPAGSAWLIPALPLLQGMNLFGSAGAWLPSFVHPFAFALLTAAALPDRASWRYGACLGWLVVNAAFELGQLAQSHEMRGDQERGFHPMRCDELQEFLGVPSLHQHDRRAEQRRTLAVTERRGVI